jgi:hypothetical protein
MVRRVLRRETLMDSISEARVVDLPEPVGPVTSTSPRGSSASLTTEGIRPISAGEGIFAGMTRSTAPTPLRCSWTFTRKRETPGRLSEVSSSWAASNLARCSS